MHAEDREPILTAAQRHVLLAGVLLVAACIAGTRWSGSVTWVRIFDYAHWTISHIAAATLTLLGWRRASGDARRARGWYALGLSSYAIGQVVYDVQTAIGLNPFPAPSDAFFLLEAPAILAGLLSQVRNISSGDRAALGLDCAGFGVAALTLILGLYLPRGPVGAFTTILLVIYPVLLLGAAGVAMLVMMRLRLRITACAFAFWLALLANGLLWMEWNLRAIDGTLADGVLINQVFSVAALLLGVGAACWTPEPMPSGRLVRAYQGLGRTLPLMFAVAGSVAIGLSSRLPPISRTVAHVGSLVVVIIAALRQSLLLRERDESLAVERAARSAESHFRQLAEEAEQRSELLAKASAALSESLDCDEGLAALTRLCVASLADWCAIDIVQDGGMRRLCHRDAAGRTLRDELSDCGSATIEMGSAAAQVLREGRPLLLSHVPEAAPRAEVNGEEEAQLVEALGTRSELLVPLSVRGAVIGVMTLCSSKPARFGQPELQLAIELARRAAIAVDNARQYREAQLAIHLRDEFLSIASHELKTPITSLELAIYRLRKCASPEAIAGAVPLVERQGKRLKQLIDELLDVSRLAAGRMEIVCETVDMAALAREVGERFTDELARTQCTVSIDAPRPVIGAWDPMALDQVVTNLISNAIKFAAGRPIEILVERQGATARLVVRDHGIGIPPDRLPHIFERFERAVSSRSYGGLGLGLYIARSIVESLGGTIEAKSRVGLGSTFTVELPCGDVSAFFRDGV